MAQVGNLSDLQAILHQRPPESAADSRHTFQHAPPSLMTLPTELFQMIGRELPVSDLVNLFLTCKEAMPKCFYSPRDGEAWVFQRRMTYQITSDIHQAIRATPPNGYFTYLGQRLPRDYLTNTVLPSLGGDASRTFEPALWAHLGRHFMLMGANVLVAALNPWDDVVKDSAALHCARLTLQSTTDLYDARKALDHLLRLEIPDPVLTLDGTARSMNWDNQERSFQVVGQFLEYTMARRPAGRAVAVVGLTGLVDSISSIAPLPETITADPDFDAILARGQRDYADNTVTAEHLAALQRTIALFRQPAPAPTELFDRAQMLRIIIASNAVRSLALTEGRHPHHHTQAQHDVAKELVMGALFGASFACVPPGEDQRKIWEDLMALEVTAAEETLTWLEGRMVDASTPDETFDALDEFLNANAMRGETKYYGLVGACSLIIEQFIPPQNATDDMKQLFDWLRENALNVLARHGMPWEEIAEFQQLQLRELFQDKSRWNVSNA